MPSSIDLIWCVLHVILKRQLITRNYYIECLEQFGDEFLRSKEYRLALAECYSRFLQTRQTVSFYTPI